MLRSNSAMRCSNSLYIPNTFRNWTKGFDNEDAGLQGCVGVQYAGSHDCAMFGEGKW